MEKPNRLAIDGDIVAYRSAAAVEKSFILVTHTLSGNVKKFKSRTEFYGHYRKKEGGWLADTNAVREEEGKGLFYVEDFTIEDGSEAEVENNAFIVCNQMIKNICKSAGVKNYDCYLDGRDNFRINEATMVKYKGGRDSAKPIHLRAVEKYMVKAHGATFSEGMETDDVISIESSLGNAIACTIDKDNLQVVGWLYDWEKMDNPVEVLPGVGKLWMDGKNVRGVGWLHLMYQMLAGDKTDNILPRALCDVKWGVKSSYNELVGVTSEKEALQRVIDKYKEWYPSPVEYQHWDTEEDITKDYMGIASEIFMLLYMKRSWEDVTTLEDECRRVGME